MNSVIDNIKNRRSIRKYKPDSIDKQLIEQIIEAGRYAPSSHNSQPWRFIIIEDKAKIKELSEYIKNFFKRLLKLGFLVGFFNKRIKNEIETAKKRLFTDQDLFFYDAPLLVLICAKQTRFSSVDERVVESIVIESIVIESKV